MEDSAARRRILNMQPPQIVAAWARGDIDAAYVWPPALTEIAKSGKIIADSEQIGKASVPTFDGLVADRAWAEKNPKFMAAFTGVMAKSYAAYRANPAAWTQLAAGQAHRQADRRQARGRGRGAGPAGVPDRRRTGLGRLAGRRQGSRRDARLQCQRAVPEGTEADRQGAGDYSPYVTDQYAKTAAK
ncbi:glycine betaine ABC transporter substrate-binding protein [Achromobacter xylosoxidans]